jgi:hypothetical protein
MGFPGPLIAAEILAFTSSVWRQPRGRPRLASRAVQYSDKSMTWPPSKASKYSIVPSKNRQTNPFFWFADFCSCGICPDLFSELYLILYIRWQALAHRREKKIFS